MAGLAKPPNLPSEALSRRLVALRAVGVGGFGGLEAEGAGEEGFDVEARCGGRLGGWLFGVGLHFWRGETLRLVRWGDGRRCGHRRRWQVVAMEGALPGRQAQTLGQT